MSSSTVIPINTNVNPFPLQIPVSAGTVVSFRYTVTGSDGADFFVSIPSSPFSDSNYTVSVALVSTTDGYVGIICPIGGSNRTSSTFRVLTDIALSVGAVLEFQLAALSTS